MYKIIVVDRSAESRNRIIEQLHRILISGNEEFHFIPRVSLKPLTCEEVRFHTDPDICIVGEEVVQSNVEEVSRIRELLPKATLIVKVPTSWTGLTSIEQLARMGVDDILTEEISSRSFLQKLILLSKRAGPEHQGRLIVVHSGKGGAGVTTLAAGIADTIVDTGKKVILVDLDYETQDLSRFLQVRPFINENLQSVIDQSTLITAESVRECLTQVWADEPNLHMLTPFPETSEVYENTGRLIRILLSVFEQLDLLADCVIIDAGAASGPLLEMLYRIADRVIYTVTNDPAALYASVDKIRKLRSLMGQTADVVLLENHTSSSGLNGKMLIDEFNRATGFKTCNWAADSLPYTKKGARWPGSGATIGKQGGEEVDFALRELGSKLGLIENPNGESTTLPLILHRITKRLSDALRRNVPQKELPESKIIQPAHSIEFKKEGQKLIPERTSEASQPDIIEREISQSTVCLAPKEVNQSEEVSLITRAKVA